MVIALLVDFYVFQAIKTLSRDHLPPTTLLIYTVFWVVSFLTLFTVFFILPSLQYRARKTYSYLMALVAGLFLGKLVGSVIFFIDDLRRAAQWLLTRTPAGSAEGISRSIFLCWLGLGLGGALFASLVAGFSNKYNYKIHRHRLKFANLPAAFRGLKIVQLSDIHSGSFGSPASVNKGIDMVQAERPDIILFTGDLVNSIASEMKDYQAVFSRLNAPMGVYSTLGNHDYGDYHWWESEQAKKANLERLRQIQAEMGWRLLMNEHVVFERGGDRIALLGIENWSAKARFPKYGKMSEAHTGTEHCPFKILMSHDPSHWDAEVRIQYPDIDLMLAGHTHGMQWGFELPGLRWSPVRFLYKQWAGLYEEGRQKLYVNRGFGFIGYPGRFGILPEITVIELA